MEKQLPKREDESEAKPLIDWEGDEEWKPGLIWWTRLDGRFHIEVRRKGEEPTIGPEGIDLPSESYLAALYIFDHNDGDKLLHAEDVGLMYGAVFGPDVDDVAQWQERGIYFVDEILPTMT